METYFSRHSGKLALSSESLLKLRQDGYVAIHYPKAKGFDIDERDSTSLDPNDYTGASKGALRSLLEFAQHGGLVAASYRDSPSVFIGQARPGARVEIRDDVWCDDSDYPGRTAHLKVVRVEWVREISAGNRLASLAFTPQQATFCRWHKVGNGVERLAYGINEPLQLKHLAPSFQEVMCSEYLRSHQRENLPRLAMLLMPIGRTMAGVDILGTSESGEKILAQVKFDDRPNYSSELESFDPSGTARLVLFCGADSFCSRGRVVVVPQSEVFKWMTESVQGKQWLELVSQSL